MDLFQFDGTYVLGMPSLMVGCSMGSPRILSALEYAKIKKPCGIGRRSLDRG